MAGSSRTVRVSGLPTDTEDDKLKDKLFIHFLRAKNGGGEIESVTIVKATPLSALITFEDCKGQWGHNVRMCAYKVCAGRIMLIEILLTILTYFKHIDMLVSQYHSRHYQTRDSKT